MATNTSNYKSSATEFCKRLTALYRLKIFPRLGNEFAVKLYHSGVEAGANIISLGDLGDADSKLKVGCDAIVKLNEVSFALQAMVAGGFYTAEETAPLSAYIEKLVEAVGKLVASIKERQAANEKARAEAMQRRLVIEQQPVVKSKVVVRSTDEILREIEEEAAQSQAKKKGGSAQSESAAANADSEGFGEPYKGGKNKSGKAKK